MQLHAGRAFQHWLWAAVERVAAGDDVDAVMRDMGYVRADLAAPAEPTDEMVEAACEAHLRAWSACEQSGYVYSAADIDDDARACIRAALRAALGVAK
jgi:hypothetical protein